jgi:hypothetical protein
MPSLRVSKFVFFFRCCFGSKTKGMIGLGQIACIRDMRNSYEIFIGNLQRKNPLDTTKKCYDNIKRDLQY